MPSEPLPLAPIAGLAAVGALLRVPWAFLKPWPWDWDAAYYRLTARSLVAGDGGRLDVLWTLAAPEAGLGAPPDLYWLPLPSRILVPEVLLGGSGLLTVALLAAALGPLTYVLAGQVGLSRAPAFMAGLLAATGGAWIRQLGSTDVYALTAVLGAIGLLGVARRQSWVTAAAIVALCLTRNDGFFLGIALAAGFGGWRMLALGALGPLVTAGWWIRSALVGGETFWAMRRASGTATEYAHIFLGSQPDPSVADRAFATLDALWGVGFLWVWAGLFLFFPLIFWGAWRRRDGPLVWPWLVGFIAAPIATALLAPAVTLGGTLERSGIALLPVHAIFIAVAVEALAARLHTWRDYHPWFTRSLLVLGWGIYAGWTGATFLLQQPADPDCARWEVIPDGQRAFVEHPLLHHEQCGAPAALYLEGLAPAQLEELVEVYRVCDAFIATDGAPPGLEGWSSVGPGHWRAPSCGTP